MESFSADCLDNPNVLNILPLTTLRTIDLEGTKNSDPLFSIFWVETRDFFEELCTRVCASELRILASEWKIGHADGWPTLVAFCATRVGLWEPFLRRGVRGDYFVMALKPRVAPE